MDGQDGQDFCFFRRFPPISDDEGLASCRGVAGLGEVLEGRGRRFFLHF